MALDELGPEKRDGCAAAGFAQWVRQNPQVGAGFWIDFRVELVPSIARPVGRKLEVAFRQKKRIGLVGVMHSVSSQIAALETPGMQVILHWGAGPFRRVQAACGAEW